MKKLGTVQNQLMVILQNGTDGAKNITLRMFIFVSLKMSRSSGFSASTDAVTRFIKNLILNELFVVVRMFQKRVCLDLTRHHFNSFYRLNYKLEFFVFCLKFMNKSTLIHNNYTRLNNHLDSISLNFSAKKLDYSKHERCVSNLSKYRNEINQVIRSNENICAEFSEP
jgi:hypothetical protein